MASEAMNQVFSPWQFRKLQVEKEELVKKTQRWYLLAYCIIAVAMLAVSPEVLKIIGDKEYWEGTTMIMWVVYAMFLNFVYTLYVNIEFFYKKTALISLGTILVAVINIVLNSLFLVNVVLKKKTVDNVFVFFMVSLVYLETLILNSFCSQLLPRVILALAFEVGFVIVGIWIYRKHGKLSVDEIR